MPLIEQVTNLSATIASLWSAIGSKADAAHSHVVADITDFNEAVRAILMSADYQPLTLTPISTGYTNPAPGIHRWTVPSGQVWQPLSAYAQVVTSATVGDRQMTLRLLSDGAAAPTEVNNILARIPPGAIQAASLTRFYTWGVGLGSLTAFRGNSLTTEMIPLLLGVGEALEIRDSSAIDTAGDAITPRVKVGRRIL